MASVATSTFTPFNAPVLTQRCGEVYYSVNLDTFFVNCQRCSEEFNLQSSELYIKHVKECLAYALRELGQRTVHTPDALHPATSYITKTELQSTPHVPPHAPNTITIKQEKDNAHSYSQDIHHAMECDDNYESQQNGKERNDGKDKDDGGDEDDGGDGDDDEDDDDDDEETEEDNAANPLTGRKKNKIMVTLIDEYKKHPCLWNEDYRTHGTYKRYDAYQAITDTINEKHNQEFTKDQIRGKVVQLRSTFKRVLRNKLAYEQKHAGSKKKKKKFIPTLWYFKRFMFIEQTTYDWEKEGVERYEGAAEKSDANIGGSVTQSAVVESAKSAVVENARSAVVKNSQSAVVENVVKNPFGKIIVHSAFPEPDVQRTFEEHVVKSDFGDNVVNTAFEKVLKNVLENITANVTENLVAKSVAQNVVENAFDFSVKNPDESAFESVVENAAESLDHDEWDGTLIYNALEAEVLLNLDEISTDSKMDEIEPSKSSKTCITKNRSLLAAVVEEYKARPSLWQVEFNRDSREKDLNQVCAAINEKFDTNLNNRSLDKEMGAVISLYKKSWRKDEKFKWKIWLAQLLSFINVYDPEPNDPDQGSSIYAENDSQDDSSSDEESQEYDTGSPISNKEKVYKIIKFLKESPILWDPNHKWHRSRVERKKCTDEIIAKLSQEHDCHLTTEEFRFQVQYLKNVYIRAERMPNAEKPFFFEEMSFLKPYVKQNPLLAFEEAKPQPKFFQFLHDDKPLMLKFIELYKAQGCLWDVKHKDRNNSLAREQAYDSLMEFFLQNGRDFNRRRLRSAIKVLHSAVTKQRAKQTRGKGKEKEPPVWFYEHLQFLGKIPKLVEKFCTHCNRLFYSLEEFKKHKSEIVGQDPFKCAICNVGFQSRSQFAYHRITHKNAHQCTECEFKTYDIKLLNVHKRRHNKIFAYHCEECGKGFVTRIEVHRHQRTHAGGKKFICEQCGKALGTNAEYKDHIKRHRNQRDFKCDICGMAFFTWNVCRDHKATHSSERKHVCETCGKAFKRKKSLVSHMALHRDEKKYKCKFCDKAYAQPSGLHAHLKKH